MPKPEQRQEVEQAFAANRVKQNELETHQRVETDELDIEPRNTPAYLPVHEVTFQSELDTFSRALHQAGISYS